ncbi:MAG: DNA polymerase III subunit delta [Gammaproteobacteria bacterium]
MQLQPQRLDAHLKSGLASVYLISGDEPLQQQEVADAIRAAARREGYEEREVLDAGTGFNWNELAMAGAGMSLFASRKIIDLRFVSGKDNRTKVSKEASQAIRDFVADPPPDTLLLISMGKLDSRAWTAAWVKAVDKAGVTLRLWPVKPGEMPNWIDARMRSRGMRPEPAITRLLADRAEGNLLAAAQEVDKLALLFGEGEITEQDAAQAIADSARYDVFTLVDAALAGQQARAIHILEGLRAEGVAPPAVVWALTAEVRKLWQTGIALAQGQPRDQAMRGVFRARIPLMERALRRLGGTRIKRLLLECQRCDSVAKGQAGRDRRPWDALTNLVNELASA